jgi:NAD(P)-dependent dehydrogenase (short-subunit alcohol dehydrogenase family)
VNPLDYDALFNLRGRTALITGASSGIGLHVARLYARAGAAVALAARRVDRIEAAAQQLREAGHRACAVPMDLLDDASIDAAMDSAEAQLGAPLNLLFNNAGVLYAARFLDQDMAEVDRVFDTNLRGNFRVAQAAARRMSAAPGRSQASSHRSPPGEGIPVNVQRDGVIVNVASTAAFGTGAQLSSYCASKAGLAHLTRIMALELASRGIRVNALCPGNFETDMADTFRDKGFDQTLVARTPLRRFGQLPDLDGAALLLASDAGRYMTGVSLVVDGGQLLSWM